MLHMICYLPWEWAHAQPMLQHHGARSLYSTESISSQSSDSFRPVYNDHNQYNHEKNIAQKLPEIKWPYEPLRENLERSLTLKQLHPASYVPFLQSVGVKFHWLPFLRGLIDNKYKNFMGGVDFCLWRSIQLSFDIGYGSYVAQEVKHKEIGTASSKAIATDYDKKSCNSNGKYGMISVGYVAHPKSQTNVYGGFLYGVSVFEFWMASAGAAVQPVAYSCKAQWCGVVGCSELKLWPNLGFYGGMRVSIACRLEAPSYPLHSFRIPGYGMITNKIVSDLSFYIKYSYTFLEKKFMM